MSAATAAGSNNHRLSTESPSEHDPSPDKENKRPTEHYKDGSVPTGLAGPEINAVLLT